MRAAVCLSGLSGPFNDKGDVIPGISNSKNICENVIDINSADVFIHSWNDDKELISKYEEIYNPKISLFEKQINFGSNHSAKSRWYSHKKVLELKKKYEKQNSFEYDYVLVSRFDVTYFKPFIFSSLEKDYFYAGDWGSRDISQGLEDSWFLSNSKIADEYADLYDFMDEYIKKGKGLRRDIDPTHNRVASNHMMIADHLIQKGIDNKVRFHMKHPADYDLTRRLSEK